MWFEILPSAGIIMALLSVPHLSAYVINKVAVGNMYRRNVETKELQVQYLRDIRLTGSAYGFKGLESIPDQ